MSGRFKDQVGSSRDHSIKPTEVCARYCASATSYISFRISKICLQPPQYNQPSRELFHTPTSDSDLYSIDIHGIVATREPHCVVFDMPCKWRRVKAEQLDSFSRTWNGTLKLARAKYALFQTDVRRSEKVLEPRARTRRGRKMNGLTAAIISSSVLLPSPMIMPLFFPSQRRLS